MKYTFDDIRTALKDAESRLPQMQRDVVSHMATAEKIHREIVRIDGAFRSQTNDLAIAAAAGDLEAAEKHMTGLNRLKTERAAAEAQFDEFLASGQTLLSPIGEMLNLAFAVAPVVAVLGKHFMEIPQPVRNELATKCQQIHF